MNVCNIYNKKVAESSETATFIDLNQCCVRTQRRFLLFYVFFCYLFLNETSVMSNTKVLYAGIAAFDVLFL